MNMINFIIADNDIKNKCFLYFSEKICCLHKIGFVDYDISYKNFWKNPAASFSFFAVSEIFV